MILLARLLLVNVKAPLIAVAICPEPLINVLLSTYSAVLILLAKLLLVDVNAPLIPADVNDEPPPVPNPAVAAEVETAVSQLTPPFNI